MPPETKICLGCKNPFTIASADFDFYKRLDAPPPLYCPNCRMQRRLVHRNERTLYRRTCDLCKKESVSIYPQDAPWPVYCATCWWQDSWNPKDYGIAYNPSVPFFEQYRELQRRVPRIGLLSITSVNSEYTNNSADNKNSYLIFAAEKCEDCLYGRLIQNCKSVVDGCFVYSSELCYECIDCRSCYKCMWSERCQSSSDLLFCFDVRDSQNCILSTNLRHKSYCIENVQYTKEEYQKKKKEILASHESIEAAKKRFVELKANTLVKYAYQTKCNNATGDYLFNCHEVRQMFDASNAKACAYLSDAEDPIDFYDGNNVYYKPELCLDIMGTIQSYHSKYCTYIFYGNEIEYSDNLHNCEYCFGCIGLRKTTYAILNKEYSPEEYAVTMGKIIDSMKREGTYGQFFPPSLSPFGYNETLAKEYFPLTKENATAKGFRWQEKTTGTYDKETIPKGAIPSTIEEVKDTIVNEVLACEECGKNFRITPMEFAFYRSMHISLPRKDFECRHQERMRARTPRSLWHRTCMCKGEVEGSINTAKHPHGTNPCSNEFETTYAPGRKETAYCEECYQREVA